MRFQKNEIYENSRIDFFKPIVRRLSRKLDYFLSREKGVPVITDAFVQFTKISLRLVNVQKNFSKNYVNKYAQLWLDWDNDVFHAWVANKISQ